MKAIRFQELCNKLPFIAAVREAHMKVEKEKQKCVIPQIQESDVTELERQSLEAE